MRVDAGRVVDGRLFGFGSGGRGEVQAEPVGTPEGRRDAMRRSVPEPGVFAVGTRPRADDPGGLTGDDGEERVAVSSPGLVAADGAQAELERAEDGFCRQSVSVQQSTRQPP